MFHASGGEAERTLTQQLSTLLSAHPHDALYIHVYTNYLPPSRSTRSYVIYSNSSTAHAAAGRGLAKEITFKVVGWWQESSALTKSPSQAMLNVKRKEPLMSPRCCSQQVAAAQTELDARKSATEYTQYSSQAI